MNIDGLGATDQPDTAAEPMIVDIRRLSPRQLAQLGLSEMAYVKPVLANGTPAFAIHSADGKPIAIAPDLELAAAAIRQHEMIPVLVH
jgi:hypothetical protein